MSTKSQQGQKFAKRGLGHKFGTVPAEPTDALPGSRRKLRVMAERVERGEQPCHPDDAQATERTYLLVVDSLWTDEAR